MGWPPAAACRRAALALFGLALALHITANAVAATLGLDLRGAVVFSELTALLGLSLWLARRLGLGPVEAFALRPATPIHFVMALAGAVPLQIAGGALQYGLLQAWPAEARAFLEEAMRELVAIESTADWLSLFAAAVVVAAVCEEVLFRGLILRLLARHGGWRSAVVVSGLLFSAFHLDPVGFPSRAVVGIYLGILVWRSGSLLPAIVAHGANNLVALYGITAAAGSTGPPEPAVSTLAVAGGVAAAIFVALLVTYVKATQPPGDLPGARLAETPTVTGPDADAPGPAPGPVGDGPPRRAAGGTGDGSPGPPTGGPGDGPDAPPGPAAHGGTGAPDDGDPLTAAAPAGPSGARDSDPLPDSTRRTDRHGS